MATTDNVTVPAQPINRRPSSAQRRAAQSASLVTQQAQLKQEAAERRALRADQNAQAALTPGAR